MRKTLHLCLCLALLAGPALGAPVPAAARAYVSASQLYAQGRYAEARRAAAESLAQDPASAAAWQLQGNCDYALGRRPEAALSWRRSLALRPENATLRAALERLEAQQSRARGLARAAELARASRWSEAEALYEEGLRSGAADAGAWQGLGNCRYALGRRAAALEAWRESLRLKPDNPGLAAFAAKAEAAQSAVPRAAARPWTEAAWRSALLPGWGQHYKGQALKGWVLGGLTLGLLAGGLAAAAVGESARQQYESLRDPGADYGGPYDTWAAMAQANHALLLGAAGLYLFTLADAALSAGGRPAAARGPSRPALALAAAPGGLGLRLKLAEF